MTVTELEQNIHTINEPPDLYMVSNHLVKKNPQNFPLLNLVFPYIFI